MSLRALRSNPWVTLVVLCTALFMNLLDTTIVYVATPSMLRGLHASLDEVLWVFNGFLLAYAVLLIPSGRLGDRFGPKRVFLAGLALFTAASAACGMAGDATQLVAARVVQGAGGALLAPQMLPFIASLFPPERRGAAFGVNGAIIGLATVAGPTVGGLVVTHFDWRWIFYLNVPVGVAAIAAAALLVPDLRPGRAHSYDVVGILLSAAGLLAVTYGLVEGQRYSWSTVAGPVTIPMLIAGGVLLLAVLVAWESRQAEPLVPLRLLRNADFSISNWIGVAMAFAMQAAFIPLSILTQSVLGMSALQSGLTFAPMSLAAGVVAPVAGRMTDRFGGRRLLAAGLALFGTGMAWEAAAASVSATSATFIAPMITAGIGMGLVFAPSLTVAMRRIRPHEAGSASGLLNTTRQVGGALGAAIGGAVLQHQLSRELPAQAAAAAPQLPASVQPGFVAAFDRAASGAQQLGLVAGPPPGVPAALAAQVHALSVRVFDLAFVAALRPTVAVAVLVIALAALSALGLERGRRQEADAARVAEIAA